MQPQHIGGLRIDSSLEFSWTARRTSSNGIGWTLEDVTSRMTIDKQDRLETARQCSLSHDMGMSQHVCREITSKIYQNQNQNHIANFRRLSKTFEDFRRPSKTFEDLPWPPSVVQSWRSSFVATCPLRSETMERWGPGGCARLPGETWRNHGEQLLETDCFMLFQWLSWKELCAPLSNFPLYFGRGRPSYKWFIYRHFVVTMSPLTRAFCNRAPKTQGCTFWSVSKSHWFMLRRSRVRPLPPNLNGDLCA